ELSGKLQSPTMSSPCGNLQSSTTSPPGIFATMAFPRVTVRRSEENLFSNILAFFYHLRVTLASTIARALPEPEAALLIAIVLGLRTPDLNSLPPGLHIPTINSLVTAFNDIGLAHLIAPSGFKVTILAGLITASTRWLYENKKTQDKYLLSTQKHSNWRHQVTTMLVVGSIAAYTLLCGAGPAAIRAGIMGILLVIAPRIGRTYNVYTALAAAALLMSLIDPFIIWDAGFLLSFLGTLGIVLLTPFFQRLLHFMESLPLGGYIAETIAVTLAAQVATWPILFIFFNQKPSLATLLTNILTVPLLGTLIMLGMLICATGMLFAPIAMLCGWVVYPLLQYVDIAVIWCLPLLPLALSVEVDSTRAWAYYILLAIVLTLLYQRWPSYFQRPQMHTPEQLQQKQRLRRIWNLLRLGVALLAVVVTGFSELTAQPAAVLTITFLNVGPAGLPSQGEAILIRTPDGKTVLVDGGLDAISLAQALDSRLPSWQHSLDALLLTSPRSDHITATQDILGRYTIGTILDAGMAHPNTTYAHWRRTINERGFRYATLAQGNTVSIGTDVTLQVLWPRSQLHSGSNEVLDNGLIVRLVAPGLRMLLLGAAAQSSYALSGLLNDFSSNSLQSEIVQMVGETNKAFPTRLEDVLQEVHPSLLVVTPGALSATQRKATTPSALVPATLLPSGNWQTLQTAQMGTVEIISSNTGWNM